MIAIRTIVCNINDEERLIAGLINCLLNSTGRKNTRGYKQGAMVYIVPTVHTAMLQPEINLASL